MVHYITDTTLLSCDTSEMASTTGAYQLAGLEGTQLKALRGCGRGALHEQYHLPPCDTSEMTWTTWTCQLAGLEGTQLEALGEWAWCIVRMMPNFPPVTYELGASYH